MPNLHNEFNLFIHKIFEPYREAIELSEIEGILSEAEKLKFKHTPSPFREKIFTAAHDKWLLISSKIQLAQDTKQTLLHTWEEHFHQLYDAIENDSRLYQLEQQLETYAFRKDTAVTHPQHTEVKALTHKLSRAVMRNPGQEVLEELRCLHGIIKKHFAYMSDKSISWLLGGAPDARGGFKNAQSFKSFFNKDLNSIPPSRLITALDTIVSAISYRSVNATWVTPPEKPCASQDPDAFKMYETIQILCPESTLVPSVGDYAYTARSLDEVKPSELKKNSELEEKYIEVFPDNISEASDVDYKEESKPKRPIPKKFFKEKLDPGKPELSWPAGAQRGHIPIRFHVSGTTPLVLSIITRLFIIADRTWIQQDDNVRKLAGAMLHPTYERGDFHTIAETAAGVEYYLEARKDRNTRKTLSPQEAFSCGLQHMAAATEGKLHTLITSIATVLIARTSDLPVLTRARVENYITILKSRDDLKLMNKALRALSEKIASSRDISAPEIIDNLVDFLVILKKSEYSHFKKNYYFFTRMPTTRFFQHTLKEIKNLLLHVLDGTKVGELSRENVAKAKQILSTYKTGGAHIINPESLCHFQKCSAQIS